MATDNDRRDQLRSFLTYARSRLSPAEVGLPAAKRRRVPGLRRQEVAELIGVSDDWYRWFESGRPITVSPQMLARTISGTMTGLDQPIGLVVDAAGIIYVANSHANDITTYAASASGNARPATTIAGSNTQLSHPDGLALH